MRAGLMTGCTADTLFLANLGSKIILRETFLLQNREAWFTVDFYEKSIKRTQNRADTAV